MNTIILAQLFEYSNNTNICGNTVLEGEMTEPSLKKLQEVQSQLGNAKFGLTCKKQILRND